MNIERKIGFKAIGLYIITGIAVVLMLIIFYNTRNNFNSQRTEVEKQQQLLALTNKLILAVNEAQSDASLFVATHDNNYIDKFSDKLHYINSYIDTLSVIDTNDKDKFQQIKNLFDKQKLNIVELNRQFKNENPLTAIRKHIGEYEPQENNVSHKVVTIKQDTVFKPTVNQKGFFSRIKEVFKPEQNNIMVVSSHIIDTVREESAHTANVLIEVKDMAQTAGIRYEKDIQALQQQVAQQISSDREISSQITNLLLYLHNNTLQSVLHSIEQREQSIKQNYSISLMSGIIGLGLILVFILLIIYDVNKGKEARERISEVMKSRHKLLLSVSHDIKSPLSSIIGYLELQQLDSENIMSMQNSARHILSLLENLLEFSSLEQGSLQLTETTFSVNELTEEIGQMFMPMAIAKNLTFNYQSDKLKIKSDQMKIKQIIINLVSNAIKYTRSGKIDLEITHTDVLLKIKISDTGAGIPADKLTEIYEPFTRVENNNALAHGTGLGMFVVKGLIDLLGGTIQISSVVNKGTTIDVDIPYLLVESNIKIGSKRIIVYDDDPAIAKMACDMLTRLGHKIVDQDYDLILTDMEMGETSGLDILASAGKVPVVLMSGHIDLNIKKATQMGFIDFLAKPFTLNDLREIFGEGNAASIDSFMEDDDEEIKELFKVSTIENKLLLEQAIANSDFNKAQAVCHKMLTMFTLLGYPTEELQRMDAQRGVAYEKWQNDVEKIIAIKV